eukprot:m.357384 g.357384  ORF g.357384 m.357384 type:complete len:79 (-) comp17810_c0_seq1:1102-1338(-)
MPMVQALKRQSPKMKQRKRATKEKVRPLVNVMATKLRSDSARHGKLCVSSQYSFSHCSLTETVRRYVHIVPCVDAALA